MQLTPRRPLFPVHLIYKTRLLRLPRHSPARRQKMTDCIRIRLKEKDNALPGERVRAVGMCFYGTGQDLVKARKYKLERNSGNVKDAMCIEVKLRGQVRATLNASISLLLAPLMDSSTVWDTTW